MKRHRILARSALIALCLCPLGCAQLEAWQAKPAVQFAESAAIRIAASYFSNGGNVDAAWGVSQGISLIGDYFASNQSAAANVTQAAKDFAGDPKAVSGFANALGNVVNKAAPQTPTERLAVVQAIAGGVAKAAGAATP